MSDNETIFKCVVAAALSQVALMAIPNYRWLREAELARESRPAAVPCLEASVVPASAAGGYKICGSCGAPFHMPWCAVAKRP